VITMNQYEYIRTAHRVYGKSIRQIQKETGYSRVKFLEGEFAEYRGPTGTPFRFSHSRPAAVWLLGLSHSSHSSGSSPFLSGRLPRCPRMECHHGKGGRSFMVFPGQRLARRP